MRLGTTGLMPELPSQGSGRPLRMSAKRDCFVEGVEEVLEVEGEEGDDEDVEEIIVEEVEVIEEEEEVEVIEEEEEEEVVVIEEEEEEEEGDGVGEAGEEDMEFSEDEREASDPGQQATIDGQKGSSKSTPPGIERSTSLQGNGSCDLKHKKSGESKVASGNVEAENSVASMSVGAAHQEEQGPTHSTVLFPNYSERADYSLTAKDKGVTYPMIEDLSYHIAHGIPDFKKDSLMDLNANKDERQIPSRFLAPVADPRDLSPHGILPERNKRQAVVCTFFAQGWCIRGKSCRFLHVKDNTSDSVKRHNSTPNSCSSDKHHEGLGNDIVLNSSGLTQSNYKNGFLSANTDAERQSADSYDKGAWSELFAVHGPSSSVSLVSTHRHEFPSSYASALARESQYMNNISSPIRNTWNPKVKPLLNSKLSTPDHFLARVIPMKNFDSLSSSASPLEPLKDLDVAYRSSLLQCQSSLSSSAFGNVLLQHKSTNSNVGSGYGRFSAYDWEPSEPFRPSFVISSTGLSFASQYSPFRDSTEKHDKVDGAFGSTYASHRTSFSNAADGQVTGHLGGSMVRECENACCSGSSNNKCSAYELKKGGYRTEREKFSGFGETAELIVKRENQNVKNDLQSANVKDTAKDRVGHKFELDVPVPHMMNWDVSRESSVLRNFRVSLIELVKELLRPTWEKSLISKDVHNLIVKKSVEKVLNTLEPQNVPPSEELTKQYLSVNEPKIAKMIKGYVEKYVKT